MKSTWSTASTTASPSATSSPASTANSPGGRPASRSRPATAPASGTERSAGLVQHRVAGQQRGQGVTEDEDERVVPGGDVGDDPHRGAGDDRVAEQGDEPRPVLGREQTGAATGVEPADLKHPDELEERVAARLAGDQLDEVGQLLATPQHGVVDRLEHLRAVPHGPGGPPGLGTPGGGDGGGDVGRRARRDGPHGLLRGGRHECRRLAGAGDLAQVLVQRTGPEHARRRHDGPDGQRPRQAATTVGDGSVPRRGGAHVPTVRGGQAVPPVLRPGSGRGPRPDATSPGRLPRGDAPGPDPIPPPPSGGGRCGASGGLPRGRHPRGAGRRRAPRPVRAGEQLRRRPVLPGGR